MTFISPLRFLVIDDDRQDWFLLERIFKRNQIAVEMVFSLDGRFALDGLSSGEIGRPDLILCDINMPLVNGPDFLSEIKNEPELQDIPVVMLTMSSDEADRQICEKRGAAEYLVKPLDRVQIRKLFQTLPDCWLVASRDKPSLDSRSEARAWLNRK